MPEEKTAMLLVTIYWPDDPDRGMETYGPFASDDERQAWVDGCFEAEGAGWRLLHGANYLTHNLQAPFDPHELWQNGGDAMRSIPQTVPKPRER